MELGDILGITSFLLAILSIYLGILVIKKQKPLFTKKTVKIIDPTVINPIVNSLDQEDKNLRITYMNESISTLSSTYITFWNAGNLRINRDDIPENKPLTVKAREGVRIFRFSILKANDENSFRISSSVIPPNITYHLSFEYLAKNDGLTLQLIHSGNSNDDIEFFGKTKEYGEFKDILTQQKNKKIFYRIGLFVSMCSFLVIIGLVIAWNSFGSLTSIVSFLIFFVYLGLISFGIDGIFNVIYPQVPKNLQ